MGKSYMNNSSTGNSPDNNSKKNRFTLRRILRAISCVIAAAGLLMITRSIVNAAFLSNYKQENYSRFPEITLLPFRFGENYIVPFNMGNIEYQQGNYDKAASYYQQALEANPPERDEECIIRVNLALSMCHKINFETLDRTDNKALEAAITQLQSARNVLTEHGCASEPVGSDDGHYENADKLKHDIDKMLEELQKQLDENKSNQDDQQSGGQGGGQNDQQNGGQGGGQNDQQNDGQGGGQDDQ
jgi:tetratricopeptide (TPR) repeat protein